MKINCYCNRKSSAGFTLAELLVVVAIIGVLVAVAIPVFSKQLYRSQAAVCQANRRNYLACYKVEYITNTGDENKEATITAALSELGISGTQATGSSDTFYITGLCRNGGTITAVCGTNGDIVLSCDKHPDKVDTTGSATQAGSFNAAVSKWVHDYGNLSGKGAFFAEYYQTNPAVEMSDAYKETLNAAGLNSSLKNNQLYWWTYPVTDAAGNLQYTVTYANSQSDPSNWTSPDTNVRGRMGHGYVVIVNGKTYIRSNSGATVQPGNTVNKYQTEDLLEADLTKNGYIVLP